MGSVFGKLRPPARSDRAARLSPPTSPRKGKGGPPQAGFFGGMLGRAYDPLFVLKDPDAKDFAVPELTLLADVSLDRLSAPGPCSRPSTSISSGPGARPMTAWTVSSRRAFEPAHFGGDAAGAAHRATSPTAYAMLRPQHLRSERAARPRA